MNHKQLAQLLESQDDPYLKLIRESRPYKIPKGYLRWEYLSAIVAFMCAQYQERAKNDRATWFNCVRTTLWFVQDAPMYLLSNDLLRALEQTDVLDKPLMLKEIKPVVSTFMLLFPDNSIKLNGVPLDYCIVHLSDRAKPELSEGEFANIKVPYLPHEHQRNLHWSTIFRDETCMIAGLGLQADGTISIGNDQLGTDLVVEEELKFLRMMRSLILQVLLLLQYKSELITVEQPKNPHQKIHTPQNNPKYRLPRWIGRDYKIKSFPKGGSHSSPRMHPRSGFMRLQPVGKGRTNYELVFVAPTWVNAPKEK